ncbi:helix-turn-helix domain-containing protein [Bacillus sp. ISL-46]|nr:helix-turn-helix domain-containing protein [Bacillus sp. ISL-46]
MEVNEFYTVKDVAKILGKSEETVKRWLRDEKKKSALFPHANKNSDKEGWKIPLSDVEVLAAASEGYSGLKRYQENSNEIDDWDQEDIKELVKLAYQAVTLTIPTEDIIDILSFVGIKRCLEILLIMQQNHKTIKSPKSYIRKAIAYGWSPSEPPALMKRAENIRSTSEKPKEESKPIPFYNWLEEYDQ